jgi:hypothetical protein
MRGSRVQIVATFNKSFDRSGDDGHLKRVIYPFQLDRQIELISIQRLARLQKESLFE